MTAIDSRGQLKKGGVGVLALGHVQSRQGQHEAGRLMAAWRIETNISTLEMGQPPGDGQAQPAAASRRSARIERVEEMRALS